jgi:hypothetical protein
VREVDDELGEDVDLDVLEPADGVAQPTRSSRLNIGSLCCGLPTTPMTTRSKIAAARVITSTWPFVTGS